MAMLYILMLVMVLHLAVVMIFIFQITPMETLLLTQILVTLINHQVDMDTPQSERGIFLLDPINLGPTKLKHFTYIDSVYDVSEHIKK